MKERRASGATHSFRLTQEACHLIETHPHVMPRELGGMSRTTSDAIVWFLSEREKVGPRKHQAGSPVQLVRDLDECRRAREFWMKKAQSEPSPPAWWHKTLPHFIRRRL